MNLPTVEPLPLEADAHGILRVTGTRVPLDNLIHEFLAGADPEEIASSYPTVPLATIYSLIGHYLANRAAVDEYLRKNEEAISVAIEEGRRNQSGLRSRLLARLSSREASSAPVSGR